MGCEPLMERQGDDYRRQCKEQAEITAVTLENTGHLYICAYNDQSQDNTHGTKEAKPFFSQKGADISKKQERGGNDIEPEEAAVHCFSNGCTLVGCGNACRCHKRSPPHKLRRLKKIHKQSEGKAVQVKASVGHIISR